MDNIFSYLLPISGDAQFKPIPITPFNFLLCQIHFIPVIYMAYLTTRSNTQPLRLMILPIVAVLTAYTGLCFRWDHPDLDSLNWLFRKSRIPLYSSDI